MGGTREEEITLKSSFEKENNEETAIRTSQSDKQTDNENEQKGAPHAVKLKKYTIFGKQIDVALISLMLMNFFLNAACSVITPFFPPLANKEVGLSNFQTGLIIGIHPLSGFAFGLLMSKNLMKYGRKKVMLFSVITTIITCTGMGVGYNLKDYPTGFFILNLICRSFMGMARSGYGSATFAYAPMLWPHKVEKMIGMMESASGLGQMCGPMIGAAINSIFAGNKSLQYQMVFYVLSGIFAIFVAPSYVMLPEDKKTPPKQKSLSLFTVLGIRQIWTLYLLLTMISASVTFTFELWTDHMATYGMSQGLSAILLTSGSFTYIISLQFVPRLMVHFIKDKGIVSFRKLLEGSGLALAVFFLMFMAPESYLGIPQAAWPVVVSIFLAGFSQGMAILPYIPEQNMLIVKLYPKKKKMELAENLTKQVETELEENRLKEGKEYTQDDVEMTVGEIIRKLYSDMAAGMFMSGYSCGTFMGPTLGGIAFDYFEETQAALNSTCDWSQCDKEALTSGDGVNPCSNQFAFQQLARIIAVLCAFVLVLYLTLGQGYLGFKDVCCRKKKKDEQLLVEKKHQRKSINEYNAKDGNLTDLLMTDNDQEFTDTEQSHLYNEAQEKKLEKIRRRTESNIAAESGAARSTVVGI